MKEYYWNEFQKHFTFDRDLSVVRGIWERQAAKRYSGTLCEWRKSGKRPVNVTQETWDNWRKHWATQEFKSKCEKASKNRRSEVAGPGHGSSRHTGGSRSAIDHSIQLEKELGRPVTDYDIFEKIHKKEDGEFVDKRSKDIADEVMACYNDLKECYKDDESIDLSSIFYEVAGPSKKKRVYGLGCKPSAAIPSTSNYATSGRNQLRSEIYEEVQEILRQKQADLEEQMRLKQQQMELEWIQKKQQMETLIRLMKTGGPSNPSTDLYPTEDDYVEEDDLDQV
ncbi:hypothetical protein ACS0TY_024458 [Phlomoides rotata]